MAREVIARAALLLAFAAGPARGADLPPNRWVRLSEDPSGGRRGSALRYAPGQGVFLLWGFMDHDPELLQELPVMEVPEYDVVAFDPAVGRWSSHLPRSREREWSARLPLAYIPRTYSAITTGSERTVLRGSSDDAGAVPRPDLNIVFDQVAWHPGLKSLVYFTGGLTAAYDPAARRWRDLRPAHSPPPVAGGSLEYDPANGEIVLFGGGHVAELDLNGRLAGYTGTWVFGNGDWRRLPPGAAPPPRMHTRMVCDPRNAVLVLFGGDAQSHYLGDTWLYDLKTRRWRMSRSAAGPPPRAGHFAVYDPGSGWVIVGGGYNRTELTDMWAYDAARDVWMRIEAETPAGFTISADIAPEKRLIVLAANRKRPGDRSTCNELYPVRATYGFRIEKETLATAPARQAHSPLPKLAPPGVQPESPPPASMPPNQWVELSPAARGAPVRTWGSATFDAARGEILYWGGGHCGYGGGDVSAYAVESGRWRAMDPAPEFPGRTWNKGVRLAGVTFRGAPWTDHGRRIYAHDPLSGLLIMVRGIRLTAGYEPEALRDYPARRSAAPDAIVQTPSSYVRYATFAHDSQTGAWRLLGPAPAAGLDTLVTTPRGVMAVNVDWPSRLNDAGYQLPWDEKSPPADTAVYLLDAAARRWTRLGGGTDGPQNLYEMTSLAWDSRRGRLLLHGGGARRDELWAFEPGSRRWRNLRPRGEPPAAGREAVYLPAHDVLLVCGPAPEERGALAVWSYSASANAWRREAIKFAGEAPRGAAGQNRAMVYDERRGLVLLVLGGNQERAAVYALRFAPDR